MVTARDESPAAVPWAGGSTEGLRPRHGFSIEKEELKPSANKQRWLQEEGGCFF